MTGAMFIAECLRQEGVEKVFGQCGHTNYALIDACHKLGIEYVSFRHEQQAAHAADAYFRVSEGSSRQEMTEQLNRRAAQKAGGRYTRLAALMTVVTRLEEAAGISALLDPRARGIGIGVAQGTRSDSVENAIVVVILIGY